MIVDCRTARAKKNVNVTVKKGKSIMAEIMICAGNINILTPDRIIKTKVFTIIFIAKEEALS